jgi:hypothetical protein
MHRAGPIDRCPTAYFSLVESLIRDADDRYAIGVVFVNQY